MKIINKTKNVTLAEEAIVATTLLKRLKGLLGTRQFNKGQAIILNPCNSIHSFFMRFPIDILFVGKNNKVIKAIPSLKPFRLTIFYFNSLFAIELPAETIKSSATSEGDILLIEK